MSFSILDITLNGQRDHIVTDEQTPTLYLRTSKLPEYVQVKVSSGEKVLFDSGKQPYKTPYLPLTPDLQPKTGYSVCVTVWKENGCDCATLSFETGFMESPWQGSWIEPKQENAIREPLIHFFEIFRPWPEPEDDGENLRPGQLLRKRFHLDAIPQRARLYATAHGVYHLRINGKPAAVTRLAPEITPYQNYLYYQCYDIGSLLQVGENEVQVELCDGWWIGRIGLSGDSCQYGNRLGFLAQLELDGRIIGTDSSWECRESHIRYSDLYIGEKWDLCKPALPWDFCTEVPYSKDNLIAQPIPGIQPLQELSGKLLVTPAGDLVADFGQVVAGVVRLETDLKAQSQIILEHSETIDQNGEFFKNIIGRNKQQRDKVIAGPGPVTFEPRHTYHGFRYVRISGICLEEIRSVKAIVLGTPLLQTGEFSCSDDRLNQLQSNIQWSMLGNMISIPTDCPQREKMGWTGDLQMFTKTGCFNMELLPFLQAWLKGLRSEQLPNGEVPLISPNFPRTDAMQRQTGGENTSSAWGDASVLVPWYLYRCTGDTKVLRDNLPMMEAWLAFIARAAAVKPENYDTLTPEQKARNPYLWQSGHHFGDWMIPSLSASPSDISKGSALTGPVIASFFYAVTLRAWIGVLDALLSECATNELQQKRNDANVLLEKVRNAACEEYISADGQVSGGLQGVYVLALYSGAVQGAQKQKVADRLVQMIRENDNKLDTGFVSTPYLLDVLSENGYRDLAYKLLLSDEPPSWLYQAKMGASTIWEKWQAVLPDGTVTTASLNHYSLGSVGDWIYRNIGGIEATEPGYQKVLFAPDVNCGLSWSRCSKQTAFGKVSCCWEKTDSCTELHLETPVEATLCLPEKTILLSPGIHSFKI